MPTMEGPISVFDLDYSSWGLRWQIIGLGFLFYSFFCLVSHILSAALCPTYRALPTREKVFWDLTATRGLFGVQTIVAGLQALTEDGALFTDKVRGQTGWSWFHMLTAMGFFLFENMGLYGSSIVYRSFSPLLFIHHTIVSAGFVGTVVWDTVGHFLPIVTMLLEMSTPFTCISWMLHKAGWSHTLFWKANQWLLVHMFHCRMVLTYYLWWVTWNHWTDLAIYMPLPLRLDFLTGLAFLTVLMNPVWTHKKTMQLLNPADNNKPAPENGPREKAHAS